MDSKKNDEEKAPEIDKEWIAARLKRKIAATDNLPVRNLRSLEPPKPIDWPHWRRQTEVMLREAVFLSFEINPDIEEHYSDFIETTHRDWQTAIYKRLRTLRGSLSNRNHFAPGTKLNMPDPNECGVRLPEFAAWCIDVDYEIPPELATMARRPDTQPHPQGTDDEMQSTDEEDSSPRRETHVGDESQALFGEALAALFDPVTTVVLEKMFPADGKWSGWTERAARNGLIHARIGRGAFNPYQAAMWFLTKREPGWDLARCNRKLADNLPVRSRDCAHMLGAEPI